jgi:hypothetical protein
LRDYAEAEEKRLGPKKTAALTAALIDLRDAIDEELGSRVPDLVPRVGVAKGLPRDESPADRRHSRKRGKRGH